MKVIFLPEVQLYFQELAYTLYQKDYFGFEDNAIQYVRELFTNIRDSLPLRQKRLASPYFDRYGKNMHYSVFRKNKRTEWYVFFTFYEFEGELIYVVRYITNNHVSAQHL